MRCAKCQDEGLRPGLRGHTAYVRETPGARPPPGGVSAERRFPSDGASIGGARQWATDTLSGWGLPRHSQVSDDVVLCVSELVTNAIRHAHSAPEVEIRLDDVMILLMVSDHRSDLRIPPRLRVVADSVPAGRGLRVVANVSRDWGVGYSTGPQHSKTVWCQFDRPTQQIL